MSNVDELILQLQKIDPQAPDKQWQAAIELGRLSEAADRVKAVPPLIEALQFPKYDALARSHSAEALGNLNDQRAVAALIAALQDPYRLTRSYAARALGKLGDAQAIDPLLKLMQTDEFFGARAEAAEALGKLCEGKDTDPCRQVRTALVAQKKIEEERRKQGAEEGRGGRVANEVERALARLGELLEQAEAQVEAITAASNQGDVAKVNQGLATLRGIMREAKTIRLNFA
jgi:HEAT repeat protein